MSFRTLFFAGCILVLCTSQTTAEPVYIDAQLALVKPERSTSGAGVLFVIGMPLPEQKNLFIEGQLFSTILEPEQHSRTLSYTHLGGYGVYQRLINAKFALHGKMGLLYQYSKIEQGDSESGTGVVFTVGTTIHHSPDMSFLLELSTARGKLDMDYISAGIRYRFR